MVTKTSPAGRDGLQAPSDQYLGYKLLIELMAHQFAFPVQWIDTQKQLLSVDKKVQRIVEIGPAKVLTSMAKKTADKLVGATDQAQANVREFLFIGNNDDARNINFEYDGIPPPIEITSTLGDTTSSTSSSSGAPTPAESTAGGDTPAVTAAAPAAAPVPVPVAVPVAVASQEPVADVDVDPTDVILALVAQKLRRSIDKVPATDSIRTLSAGQSVLQNEIIGDLAAEFGELPSGSEELSIADLGGRLAASGFSGKPGKASKKLLERMFSLKMPAGFGRAEAEAHMQARWGLGPNRVTTVLCLAITMEPPTRLESADKVHEFLAAAVAKYSAHAGIPLPERSASASGGGSSGASSSSPQVDAAAVEALKKDQAAYLRKQFQVLAKHLNIDELPEVAAAHLSNQELIDLRERLAGLQTELDDEFLLGIRGVFDGKKQRRYASWWNWAREDLLRLLHASENRPDDGSPTTFSPSLISPDRLNTLVNRWNSTIEVILRRYATTSTGLAKRIATDLLAHRENLVEKGAWPTSPVYRYSQPAMRPRSSVDDAGTLHYVQEPRSQTDYVSVVASHQPPHVHLRSRVKGVWEFDAELSAVYLTALSTGLSTGLTFAGKTALVTGAGPGSIGSHLVQGLLAGGARVIVTTNRTPSSAAPFFAQMYKETGAPGSELIVLPFNAASLQDCQDLVTYIYDKSKGLGADLDLVIPFAAVPENGRELDQIDARSELAHRAMLVNLLRLLGSIKQAKEKLGVPGRPAAVVLPLSPNHGDFGGDGLYSESKLGLETLFNRFQSESWSRYLSVVGAVIGWTRGTGLMNGNDVVAQGVEDLGVLTFTAQEMALNILALLAPKVLRLANQSPLYADISGGLLGFENLKERISAIRTAINSQRSINKAVAEERARHLPSTAPSPNLQPETSTPKPRSNIRQDMPALLPHPQMTRNLPNLRGMIDLHRTVVVVGFSELGPWGSSRTRWQMESQSTFTQDGFTEMAWIMGLIKHGNGAALGPNNKPYFGWVDVKTNKPIHDADIAARYGEHILSNTGIRTIQPSDGLATVNYSAPNKEVLQEVVLDDDLPPFSAPESVAKSFQLRHGAKCTIRPSDPSSPDAPWTVTLAKGATFHIPKTVPFRQTVAAQLPAGWDPATYGIPPDVVAQVDPITLYALCCVSEAIFSAGITDISELYSHIHVAELGNYIGSGAGGLQALQSMYRNRYVEGPPVQSDILQETFLNSIAAWTNMLLLGAAGPIKTPVGACATAVESLDTACEAIRTGSVKAAFVGGVDDFGEEASFEFDSMKATANAADERAKGYLPREASRPTSSSRAGFVEAAGCGVQLVMTAALALEMGLPIRAIVAYTQMSADGISRSLPAPGHGVLTAARELPTPSSSPEQNLLSLSNRRTLLSQTLSSLPPSSPTTAQQTADAKYLLSTNLRTLLPSISPLRAALAAWGLTPDDLAVASFHGTSTKANDINESRLINDQMIHLSRTPGNPLLVVAQKHLTGHPKGAAAAWQLNGIMQMFATSLVPGNRNADDVDSALREFEHLVYPSAPIAGVDIKACMLTSFGFGQKGGVVLAVSPRLLAAALSSAEWSGYIERVAARRRKVDRAYQLAMMENRVFVAKDQSPWVAQGREDHGAFLDPKPFRAGCM
ncbi:putative fatty acid synthase alpha subunit FasA [Cercophora scortea]|uniref:beta-ketoacyl-[acyl-carrier-protein] synthase I n=1 Tax=Cercophora scortea TaxID=314031 RepID=A0AAE0IX50_9PEZI|nr:putative fatty acid synthase alpha subunit FasA [Cercophora scortea]